MTATAFNVADITPAWHSFRRALPIELGTIRSETQYRDVIGLMNNLVDAVGDNEKHELADFLDLLGQLIEDYENAHLAIPDAEPRAVLQFLMESHGLKQSDMAAEIGGQSVVSEILNGKREINVRQAKALASRFGVSPAVFI